MSQVGFILVRIFPYSDWIRTLLTPNTDTFHAVASLSFYGTSNIYHHVTIFFFCIILDLRPFVYVMSFLKNNSLLQLTWLFKVGLSSTTERDSKFVWVRLFLATFTIIDQVELWLFVRCWAGSKHLFGYCI